MTQRPPTVIAAAVAAVVLVGGCRGSGGGSAAPRVWDQSQIVHHLGLHEDAGSWTVTVAGGVTCDVAVVLTDAGQVNQYRAAGDIVAINPSGTAGVKIVTAQEATCLRELTSRLATLSP